MVEANKAMISLEIFGIICASPTFLVATTRIRFFTIETTQCTAHCQLDGSTGLSVLVKHLLRRVFLYFYVRPLELRVDFIEHQKRRLYQLRYILDDLITPKRQSKMPRSQQAKIPLWAFRFQR